MKKNKTKNKNKKIVDSNKKAIIIPKIQKLFNALFTFSEETKKIFLTLFLFLSAIIIFLSFFDLAGRGGIAIKTFLTNLYGSLFWLIPFFLLILIIFIKLKPLKVVFSSFPFFLIFTFLLSAFLSVSGIGNLEGGKIGEAIVNPLIAFFDVLATKIILLILILAGFFYFYIFLKPTIDSIILKIKKNKIKKGEEKNLEKIKEIAEEEFKKEDKEEKNFKKLTNLNLFKVSKTIKNNDFVDKNDLPIVNEYISPPINLLAKEKENFALENSEDRERNQKIIKKTLENFNIPAEMLGIKVGPTVTQYSFKPAEGIKLSKITGLGNDLALSLAAHPVRIEAPIPGKSLVGIEVPNKIRTIITLRSLLEVENLSNNSFYIPLGRDVAGTPVYFNLFKMPHLLVAGATGTGKTVFLNSLIISLIFRNSPDLLRLILIDPKRVEFANYNDIPHLLCPVITDSNKAINALNWLIIEMERRFDMFLELGVRDISIYNEIIRKRKVNTDLQIMPYIVLILDELADLMNVSGKDLEIKIMRLAQKARAVGIHLVLATQRPSVNIITGVIKANIVARVAFTVVSQVDSRTILDSVGAERLIGAGDMLFMSSSSPYPKRIQGAYISEKETDKTVEWINLNVKRKEDLEDALFSSLDDILKGNYTENQMSFQSGSEMDSFYDPLYEEAKEIILDTDRASTSLLQRRLKIGYARAARLIDVMEQKGIIGPARGAKPRKILIDKEQN